MIVCRTVLAANPPVLVYDGSHYTSSIKLRSVLLNTVQSNTLTAQQQSDYSSSPSNPPINSELYYGTGAAPLHQAVNVLDGTVFQPVTRPDPQLFFDIVD